MSSNQALMWIARGMLKIPANEAAATPTTTNWPEVDQ
jgi:hypothetical protein